MKDSEHDAHDDLGNDANVRYLHKPERLVPRPRRIPWGEWFLLGVLVTLLSLVVWMLFGHK